MQKKYDVIIVGGGPAGARCAEILARESIEVLLIEKKKEGVINVVLEE